jgi:hypothetical protein
MESGRAEDLKKRFERREKYVCELVLPGLLDVFEVFAAEGGDIQLCVERWMVASCWGGWPSNLPRLRVRS